MFLNHISNAFLLFTISIIDQENQKDIDSIIVDGRGIGYRKKARLNWMRGTQVRKVKDHIRCEVMMTKESTS